ncbi:MAG: nucleoside monophosphate kinase [Rickettsiales bacterium]|jgi:adenylate kinase|nr:nucleoside monophosphate kinase [Rickettsiales bacterium]
MSKIVFIGPAGSGKGTQGLLTSKYYNIPLISTGNLLRKRVKDGDEFGRYINDLISKGVYVSNEIILSLLAERLAADDCLNGFILDGFPRNVDQAAALKKHLEPQDIDAAIVLNVPRNILLERITGRHECNICGSVYNKFTCKPKIEGVCDVCGSNDMLMRADDNNDEAINRRLDFYDSISEALIDYYRERNLIYFIDAIKDIKEVFGDIRFVLDNLNVANKDLRGDN